MLTIKHLHVRTKIEKPAQLAILHCYIYIIIILAWCLVLSPFMRANFYSQDHIIGINYYYYYLIIESRTSYAHVPRKRASKQIPDPAVVPHSLWPVSETKVCCSAIKRHKTELGIGSKIHVNSKGTYNEIRNNPTMLQLLACAGMLRKLDPRYGSRCMLPSIILT